MNADFSAATTSEAEGRRGGAGYVQRAGVHDEMVDAAGAVRPAWRGLVSAWVEAGAEGRGQIGRDARRALEEAGLSFNPYLDTGPGAARSGVAAPWRFDHFPLAISAEEWARLAAGVAQRTRMAEKVLADIYGRQSLFTSGALAPAAVLGGGGYMRAAALWDRPPKRWLLRSAVDVARTASGEWVVLDDAFDRPEGVGWALANRVALGQAASEMFVSSGARRLARWFDALREALERDATAEGRMACVTPGPSDPAYFSYAYLARYLGLTLVEPGDLAARDGEAHVKTLEGLRRVDVMLRGAASAGIDPLYAPGRAGHAVGPPGLLRAARLGRVSIVNAIGAGAVDGRVLAPFSARLIRELLGEEPILAEAESLWLGDPAARARYLDDPRAWRVTETAAVSRPGSGVEDALAGLERPALERRLAREGWRYVARAPVRTGLAPCAQGGVGDAAPGGDLAGAPFAMRVFVLAGPDGPQAMPGGLAFSAPEGPLDALPWRGASKDVWVVDAAPGLGLGLALGGGEPAATSRLGERRRVAHLQRTGRDLLSRVADDLFWLGRYGERADLTLRVLKVVIERMIDAPRRAEEPALLARLLALRIDAPADAAPEPTPDIAELRLRIMRLAVDPELPESATRAVEAIYWNANRARAHLSRDAWRDVGALHAAPLWRMAPDPARALSIGGRVEDAIRSLAAFAGASHENMTRNFAWRFLELGRRLQRGMHVAQMFRALAAVPDDDEPTTLYALLLLCDSFFAYRSRYLTTPEATPAIDLLILDEANPRSLAYQVAQAEAVLGALPRATPYRNPEHRKALRLLTDLRVAEAPALGEVDASGRRAALLALLDDAEEALLAIAELVTSAYFAHAEPALTEVSAMRFEPPKEPGA